MEKKFQMEQVQALMGYLWYHVIYDREEFDIKMRRGQGLRGCQMSICQLENPLEVGIT